MARKNELTNVAEITMVMVESSPTFRGKKICITGHLAKPRKEVVSLIEQVGGVFHDAVKWDTNYLLTNSDWTAGSTVGKVSSKFQKARSNGVKFISEQEFYDILARESAVTEEQS